MPQEETTLSRRTRGRKIAPAGGKPPASEGAELPSRRVKHPSNKYQTVKWFYNTLIVLFLLLMAALFWFGRQLSAE